MTYDQGSIHRKLRSSFGNCLKRSRQRSCFQKPSGNSESTLYLLHIMAESDLRVIQISDCPSPHIRPSRLTSYEWTPSSALCPSHDTKMCDLRMGVRVLRYVRFCERVGWKWWLQKFWKKNSEGKKLSELLYFKSMSLFKVASNYITLSCTGNVLLGLMGL